MELFDICDEKGIPTGRVTDRKTAHREGILHRTAHIWIVRKSPDGRTEILLQKRAACKDSFPGEYDTSSAGHITAGDEPLHGALRELSEELGIFAAPEDLHFAGNFRIQYELPFHGEMFRDNEVTFVYVYGGSVAIDRLHLQPEEIECVEWFSLDEVWESCQNGSRIVNGRMICVPDGGLQVLRRYLGVE